jgi:hypothetical protein
MSEFEPKFETGKHAELDSSDSEKRDKHAAEKRKEAAEAAAEAVRERSIEAIQDRIEKAALDKEQIQIEKSENTASQSPVQFGTAFGKNAAKQTIKRTQKKLAPPERAFSKVIHQPVVEALSNVGEKTIARPSGLLAGGLFSVLSSLAILYVCRHYGYEYNFMVGLAGFVGGFALGVLIEGIVKLIKR